MIGWLRRRRMAMEQRIAGVLAERGELSGYHIGEALWPDGNIKPGSLYPALDRMERRGAVMSRWGIATAERGWRRPRLYQLTAQRGEGG